MSVRAKRILLVDDDEDFVEAITLMLEFEGYEVVAARSGEECLKSIEEKRPDLVLLDIMMEKLTTGLQVGYELHNHPEYKSIPIIHISGIRVATGLDIATAKESDYVAVTEFLEKPVKLEVLLQRVAELVG